MTKEGTESDDITVTTTYEKQVECKGGDLTYGVNVRDPQRTSVQRLRKDSGQ